MKTISEFIMEQETGSVITNNGESLEKSFAESAAAVSLANCYMEQAILMEFVSENGFDSMTIVQEAGAETKPNIFKRMGGALANAWKAIVKFFKTIWAKITGFFKSKMNKNTAVKEIDVLWNQYKTTHPEAEQDSVRFLDVVKWGSAEVTKTTRTYDVGIIVICEILAESIDKLNVGFEKAIDSLKLDKKISDNCFAAMEEAESLVSRKTFNTSPSTADDNDATAKFNDYKDMTYDVFVKHIKKVYDDKAKIESAAKRNTELIKKIEDLYDKYNDASVAKMNANDVTAIETGKDTMPELGTSVVDSNKRFMNKVQKIGNHISEMVGDIIKGVANNEELINDITSVVGNRKFEKPEKVEESYYL